MSDIVRKIIFLYGEAHYEDCLIGKEILEEGKPFSYCKECTCGIEKKLMIQLMLSRRIAELDFDLCPCGCEDIEEEERETRIRSQEYKDAIKLLSEHGYEV